MMLKKMSMEGKGCNRIIYKYTSKKSNNVVLHLKNKGKDLLNEEVSTSEKEKGFLTVHKFPKCVYNKYVQFKFLHNRLNASQLLCK